MTKMWWVNQGRSAAKDPRFLDTVWAPLENKAGQKNSSWELLNEVDAGDVVIHYATKAIRGFSFVTAPAFSMERPMFDSERWGDAGRGLVVDFIRLESPIPLTAIPESIRLAPNKQSPFDKNGEVVQGYLFRVFPELKKHLELLLDATFDTTTENEAATKFTFNGKTDGERIAAYRREQPHLRKYLLKDQDSGICGICGHEFPADYLVAAHIKKRALATERERQDENIVFLACKLGCDTAFELGHIQVDKSGQILVSQAAPPVVKSNFAGLCGKQASAFTSLNKKYFDYHRNSFTRPKR